MTAPRWQRTKKDQLGKIKTQTKPSLYAKPKKSKGKITTFCFPSFPILSDPSCTQIKGGDPKSIIRLCFFCGSQGAPRIPVVGFSLLLDAIIRLIACRQRSRDDRNEPSNPWWVIRCISHVQSATVCLFFFRVM